LQDVRGKKWIVVGDMATFWERARWMWRRKGRMSRGEGKTCMIDAGEDD
jgi:hypothetical protein